MTHTDSNADFAIMPNHPHHRLPSLSPVLSLTLLALACCSTDLSLEQQITKSPILQIEDDAMPTPRVFSLVDAVGWEVAASGVDAGSFTIQSWRERNGTPGYQPADRNGDELVSSISETATSGNFVNGGYSKDPEIRTAMLATASGEPRIERMITGCAIGTLPQSHLDQTSWNELVRFHDLGIAVELQPDSGEGMSGFRLRALTADWSGASLRFVLELADTPSNGELSVANAVYVGPQTGAAPQLQRIATSWLNVHGQQGVRTTVLVERDAKQAPTGIRLVLEPAR